VQRGERDHDGDREAEMKAFDEHRRPVSGRENNAGREKCECQGQATGPEIRESAKAVAAGL